MIKILIGIIMNFDGEQTIEHLKFDYNHKQKEIKVYIQQKYDVLNLYVSWQAKLENEQENTIGVNSIWYNSGSRVDAILYIRE